MSSCRCAESFSVGLLCVADPTRDFVVRYELRVSWHLSRAPRLTGEAQEPEAAQEAGMGSSVGRSACRV
jgi:hypothetical protein